MGEVYGKKWQRHGPIFLTNPEQHKNRHSLRELEDKTDKHGFFREGMDSVCPPVLVKVAPCRLTRNDGSCGRKITRNGPQIRFALFRLRSEATADRRAAACAAATGRCFMIVTRGGRSSRQNRDSIDPGLISYAPTGRSVCA